MVCDAPGQCGNQHPHAVDPRLIASGMVEQVSKVEQRAEPACFNLPPTEGEEP